MGDVIVEKRVLQGAIQGAIGLGCRRKIGLRGGCDCPVYRGNLPRATALPQVECVVSKDGGTEPWEESGKQENGKGCCEGHTESS